MRGELRHSRVRAASAALVTLAAIAASVTMGSSAIAGSAQHIARQPGAPAHVHYMPASPVSEPPAVQQPRRTTAARSCSTSNTYAVFWEPKQLQNGDPAVIAKGFNAGVIRYFKDVSGTGLYNNNTQYYQVVGGNQQNIKNVSTFVASWVDTHAYPASGCTDPATPDNCVTDAQIRAEVTHAQQVNGWSPGATNAFFVFTAGGEGTLLRERRIMRVHRLLRLPRLLR